MNRAEKFTEQARIVRRAKIFNKIEGDSAAGLYQSFVDRNTLDPEVIEELENDGFWVTKDEYDEYSDGWCISWRPKNEK